MRLADWAGLLLMVVPGLNALGYGVMLLYAPQRLLEGGSASGRSAHSNAFFLVHRTSTSLCLIAGGTFCIASALYVWLRLNA